MVRIMTFFLCLSISDVLLSFVSTQSGYDLELSTAIDAAKRASRAAQRVAEQDFSSVSKEDNVMAFDFGFGKNVILSC
jgi:hypothetical protein